MRKGIMAGIPADELFVWIYVIALSAIAAAGTIGMHNLSARMNAAKDRELQPAQSVTGAQIEAAMADATEASARTADLVRANGELQQELQEEKDARRAMPQRFQPRDMTPSQLQGIAGASPIIALKPPVFLRASDQPIPSGMETDNVPRDLLSRAE